MTGSIPDPRLEAGIERLLMSHPSWFKRLSTSRNRSPEHPDHADVRYAAQTIVEAVLRAIDAADEASGVRRVTGGFEARLMSLEFPTDQEAEERGIDGLLATFDVPEGRKWPAGAYLIARLSAADSPVGGVS